MPRLSISIHALREESDSGAQAKSTNTFRFQSTLSVRRATTHMFFLPPSRRFQSTLSVRRATRHVRNQQTHRPISIHALREESDMRTIDTTMETHLFQSTLSVRRATHIDQSPALAIQISIHALREESDFPMRLLPPTTCHFNPRSP